MQCDYTGVMPVSNSREHRQRFRHLGRIYLLDRPDTRETIDDDEIWFTNTNHVFEVVTVFD